MELEVSMGWSWRCQWGEAGGVNGVKLEVSMGWSCRCQWGGVGGVVIIYHFISRIIEHHKIISP